MSPEIRVFGGYCKGCSTYFVGVEVSGVEIAMKHGFEREEEAKAKFEQVREELQGTTSFPDLEPRLNRVFEMLNLKQRCEMVKRSAAPSPFGKPRFG